MLERSIIGGRGRPQYNNSMPLLYQYIVQMPSSATDFLAEIQQAWRMVWGSRPLDLNYRTNGPSKHQTFHQQLQNIHCAYQVIGHFPGDTKCPSQTRFKVDLITKLPDSSQQVHLYNQNTQHTQVGFTYLRDVRMVQQMQTNNVSPPSMKD